MNSRTFQSRSRGFTFVELSISLVVTALVVAGIATLTYGLSVQWRSSETAQSVMMSNIQAETRLEQTLRKAKYLKLSASGGSIASQNPSKPASLLFWRGDANLDSAMQFSEVGLLEHDRASNSLKLYTVKWPSNWTTVQKTAADVVMTTTDLATPSAASDFKALAYVTGATLVTHVTAASFADSGSGSSTERPRLDVVLKTTIGTVENTSYISAVLRGPNNSPSSTAP